MNFPKRLKIVSVDLGPNDNILNCEVLSNSTHIDTVSLIPLAAEPKELYLPSFSTTIVQFKINPSSRSPTLQVSLPVSLLDSSIRYLPLFSTDHPDLSSIPSTISFPRLQIHILEDSRRTPEGVSESFIDPYDSFVSDLALAGLIDSPYIDSQDFIYKNDISSKYKKQAIVLQVITKQLELTKGTVTQLIEKIGVLEAKLVKAADQLATNSQNSHTREEYLLEVIQAKDKEIYDGLCDNMILQARIRHFENENEHIIDKASRLQIEIERFREIENELEIANAKLNKADILQEQLTDTIYKIGKNTDDDGNFKTQLAFKDQEIQLLKSITEEVKKSGDMQISSLRMEVEELKSYLQSYQENNPLASSSNYSNEPSLGMLIDKYFVLEMEKLNLENSYSKLKDFTYQVKGKVVSVACCRGGIFARSGSYLVNLDNYLADEFKGSITPRAKQEIQNNAFINKNIETEPDKKIILKASSQKTFLRATKSSLCKIRTTLDKSPLKDRKRVKSSERKAFR